VNEFHFHGSDFIVELFASFSDGSHVNVTDVSVNLFTILFPQKINMLDSIQASNVAAVAIEFLSHTQ
jgi:hypothetical protein